MCIVHTTVGEKAHLRTKLRQTVKKSSLQVYPLSSYAWLKAPVSQNKILLNRKILKFHRFLVQTKKKGNLLLRMAALH